jgi:hypothetical protein
MSAAAPTSCLASDRTALALPPAHYCLRPRARSGSTDPVFLPRSHDNRYVNSLTLCGSCSLSRPDRIRRPPYPTLARILLAAAFQVGSTTGWLLSDYDLRTCGGQFAHDVRVRRSISDHQIDLIDGCE